MESSLYEGQSKYMTNANVASYWSGVNLLMITFNVDLASFTNLAPKKWNFAFDSMNTTSYFPCLSKSEYLSFLVSFKDFFHHVFFLYDGRKIAVT